MTRVAGARLASASVTNGLTLALAIAERDCIALLAPREGDEQVAS